MKRCAIGLIVTLALGLLVMPVVSEAQPSARMPRKAGKLPDGETRRDAKDLNLTLIEAASRGDTATVQALITKGADVNVKDERGLTALHYTAMFGHGASVRALVAAGANVHAKDNRGLTALMQAAGVGQQIDRRASIQALLAGGANVNAKDRHGVTALMLAVWKDDTATVQALITKGADVNAKDKHGLTALRIATENDYTKSIKLLKRAGAVQHAVSVKEPLYQGKPIGYWIQALRHPHLEDYIQNEAVNVIAQAGPDAKTAVATLIETLTDKRGYGPRDGAAYALGEIGPAAKTAVPALIEVLRDTSDSVAPASARALGEIGQDAKAAVPALIEALKNKDVRRQAGWALGKIGEVSTVALIETLKDKDVDIRLEATRSLAMIASGARAAVPDLVMMLGDENPHIRGMAIGVLGKIGPHAKDAVPALTNALEDKSYSSAYNLLSGLLGIEYYSIPSIRWMAVWALGEVGADAATAVPALVKILEDSEGWSEYRDVRITLEKIGPPAAPALLQALLQDATKNENSRVKKIAGEVLIAIGPAAVPALSKVLMDEDWYVRIGTVVVLEKIGPPAVPALVEALKNPNWDVRYTAADALGNLGPAAKAGIPALTYALKDPQREVRERAVQALEKIQGGK